MNSGFTPPSSKNSSSHPPAPPAASARAPRICSSSRFLRRCSATTTRPLPAVPTLSAHQPQRRPRIPPPHHRADRETPGQLRTDARSQKRRHARRLHPRRLHHPKLLQVPAQHLQRRLARSTNTTSDAPRLKASIPTAPEPAYKSRNRAPSILGARMLNNVSRSRSLVGRVASPSGAARTASRILARNHSHRSSNSRLPQNTQSYPHPQRLQSKVCEAGRFRWAVGRAWRCACISSFRCWPLFSSASAAQIIGRAASRSFSFWSSP